MVETKAVVELLLKQSYDQKITSFFLAIVSVLLSRDNLVQSLDVNMCKCPMDCTFISSVENILSR